MDASLRVAATRRRPTGLTVLVLIVVLAVAGVFTVAQAAGICDDTPTVNECGVTGGVDHTSNLDTLCGGFPGYRCYHVWARAQVFGFSNTPGSYLAETRIVGHDGYQRSCFFFSGGPISVPGVVSNSCESRGNAGPGDHWHAMPPNSTLCHEWVATLTDLVTDIVMDRETGTSCVTVGP